MKFRVVVVCMGLAAIAPCARAASPPRAPGPLLVPARDVTVEYLVTPAGRPAVDVVVAVSAGGQQLHITSQDLPTTILVNRAAETADIMLPLLRAYAEISIGKYDPQRTILQGAAFFRDGERQIMGRHCTAWRAVSHDGHATACVTADGVILRGAASLDRKGELGRVEARRVVYGALPAEMFRVPAHFQKSPFRFDPAGQPE